MPVIAQERGSGDVLMFAWMNRQALAATAERGQAVYWSRSRQRLWHKGEESGHVPVSYTHLDVYKRQRYARSGFKRLPTEHLEPALQRLTS